MHIPICVGLWYMHYSATCNVDHIRVSTCGGGKEPVRKVTPRSHTRRHVAYFRKAGRQGQARRIVEGMLAPGVEELAMEYPVTTEIDKADPPQQVIEAFNDVNVAEQDAETNINRATQYANQVVPQARGTAQRLLQEAEGYRDQIVADAQGEASRFEQIYEEYRKAPRVTRERMYLETMERVLERTDKTILDNRAGAVPYLPLDRVQPANRGGQN